MTRSISLGRFGVVGDVHAQDARLELLLGLYAQMNLDAVLCCGDIVDGPGDPNRCASMLQEAGCFVVRGNHDRWMAEGVLRDLPDAHLLTDLSPTVTEWLDSLPATISFKSPRGPIELAHGVGSDDMNRLREDSYGYALEVNEAWQQLVRSKRATLIVKGHTHYREVFTMQDIIVVDGGTLLDHGPPGGVIIDLSDETYLPVDFDGSGSIARDEVSLPKATDQDD